MPRSVITGVIAMICLAVCVACGTAGWCAAAPGAKVVVFVSEQNIEGPQAAWWASEIDLSVTESRIAQALLQAGFDVLEPASLTEVIEKDRAFRTIGLAEKDSLKIGQLSRADYVILGKAVASAGGAAPQSRMRSCYANITVRLLQVNTGKVIAYLDASGTSVHPDVITGGREALVNAAGNLGQKVVEALQKNAAAVAPTGGADVPAAAGPASGGK